MSTALNDGDEWRDLSSNEQSEILQEGLQEKLGDEPGVGDIPRWEDTDDVTQEQTLAAIEGALDETWTLFLFEDEDRATVPFEMSELTEAQQDEVSEWITLFGQIEQSDAESLDELRERLDDADEMMNRLETFETWVNEFLAGVTTGDTFDAEWWTAGKFPAGTRLGVFGGVVDRYKEQMTGAQSFR